MADGQRFDDGKTSIRRIWFLRRFAFTASLYAPLLGGVLGAGAMVLRNAGAGIGGGAFSGIDPVRVGVYAGLATIAFCALFYGNALLGSFKPSKRYIDAKRDDLPDALLFVRPGAVSSGSAAAGGAPSAPKRAQPRTRPGSVLEQRAARRPNPAQAVS